jgi:pimeloyl-ACP methyl ester carboxylesterase
MRESVEELRAPWIDALENHWGEGEGLSMFMPSLGTGLNALRMLGMFERASASPTMVLALDRFNTEVDVTEILPVIGVPTLVLHRTDDAIPVVLGRYVAEHVPGGPVRGAGGERPHAVGRR